MTYRVMTIPIPPNDAAFEQALAQMQSVLVGFKLISVAIHGNLASCIWGA